MDAQNSTWTTFSHGVKDWWESPSGTVVRIELFVAVVAICMLLLAACGSLRRRSQSFFAQRVVLAAYLSSSLVSYTLGSMQSSPVKSIMYPFWAVSLYLISGSVDSMTAYSLDDNSQQMRKIYETALCMFYAVLIAVTILNDGIGIGIFIELACLAGLKCLQRHWACIVAVGSWNLNKMVSDYMHHEHTRSESSSYYDPASMKGYHYLVDWPLHNSKLEAGTLYEAQVITTEADAAHGVVDIEMIWQCESLSSEEKDTCLSFSLFHLLRRRFFGFACAESSRQQTHDFVFKGLLAKNEDGDINCNRVFKVIDVELAFMYDFFFTKYAVIYYAALGPTMVINMLIAVAPLEVPTANIHTINARDFSAVATTTTADFIITLLIFTSFSLLEAIQMSLYSTTIWSRVNSTCNRIRDRNRGNPGIPGRIISWMGTCISYKCYWQNKLGQYSLLESVRYNDPNSSKARLSAICMKFIRACFKLVNYEIIHPFINFSVRRKVISKPGKPVELSAQVKDALVQSLQLTQGVLTNGQLSLRSNGADDLLWACRNGDTHPASSSICILTWHIATCYCDMATRVGGAAFKHHIDVATKLSKYCAYLMVKEPKLLPGHHYDTIRVFDAVAEEALVFLQTEQNKYEAMEELPESLSETAAASLPGSNEKIFHMGVRLGKQLEGMEEGARWKVLAEFWAEMLLYLAPSDNVKAHVECLAKGGELITHLWALLTHAGILDRSQRNVANDDIENAGTGQGQPAYTGEGSSYGSHSRSQAAPDTHAPYQPATSPNLEQSGGTMVQQRANQVQNVERSPIARTAPSDVKEIEIITSEE